MFSYASLSGVIGALVVLAVLAGSPANAAEPSETVLARRGDVVITRADWDAEIQRIPAKDRAEFASNLRRSYSLLERMLTTRELALEAKRQKLDLDPTTQTRIRQEEERILAAAFVVSAEDAAARDFDARQQVFERRARELYEVDKRSYASPETVMITTLYFAADKDGFEGAGKRADAALAKIKAGADIGDLASTVSDDPTTRDVRGRKGPLAQSDLEPALARAAFALKAKGDVSDVVRARDGFWIIRLDERRPSVPRSFDEVKGTIMADLRQQQVAAARTAAANSAGGGKEIEFNAPAIEALRSPASTPSRPAGS
jgi:parvulin-like peptidyl-prolyl isomerase